MKVKNKYAVYSHSFSGVVFYIGSGRVYEKEERQISRPYNFIHRSPEWFEFCNNKTEQVEIEILFETNDKKESLDVETELTKTYMERGFPLVNKSIGTHLCEETKQKMSESHKGKILSKEHRRKLGKINKGKKFSEEHRRKMSESHKGKKFSEEHKKKISESGKGENNHNFGKTTAIAKKMLVINNESGESKIFDSIARAYEFIAKEGYKKVYATFCYNINKGAYSFNEYTMELV